MSYSYTDGDKNASPNTYFYTEYNGQEFFKFILWKQKIDIKKNEGCSGTYVLRK